MSHLLIPNLKGPFDHIDLYSKEIDVFEMQLHPSKNNSGLKEIESIAKDLSKAFSMPLSTIKQNSWDKNEQFFKFALTTPDPELLEELLKKLNKKYGLDHDVISTILDFVNSEPTAVLISTKTLTPIEKKVRNAVQNINLVYVAYSNHELPPAKFSLNWKGLLAWFQTNIVDFERQNTSILQEKFPRVNWDSMDQKKFIAFIGKKVKTPKGITLLKSFQQEYMEMKEWLDQQRAMVLTPEALPVLMDIKEYISNRFPFENLELIKKGITTENLIQTLNKLSFPSLRLFRKFLDAETLSKPQLLHEKNIRLPVNGFSTFCNNYASIFVKHFKEYVYLVPRFSDVELWWQDSDSKASPPPLNYTKTDEFELPIYFDSLENIKEDIFGGTLMVPNISEQPFLAFLFKTPLHVAIVVYNREEKQIEIFDSGGDAHEKIHAAFIEKIFEGRPGLTSILFSNSKALQERSVVDNHGNELCQIFVWFYLYSRTVLNQRPIDIAQNLVSLTPTQRYRLISKFGTFLLNIENVRPRTMQTMSKDRWRYILEDFDKIDKQEPSVLVLYNNVFDSNDKLNLLKCNVLSDTKKKNIRSNTKINREEIAGVELPLRECLIDVLLSKQALSRSKEMETYLKMYAWLKNPEHLEWFTKKYKIKDPLEKRVEMLVRYKDFFKIQRAFQTYHDRERRKGLRLRITWKRKNFESLF